MSEEQYEFPFLSKQPEKEKNNADKQLGFDFEKEKKLPIVDSLQESELKKEVVRKGWMDVISDERDDSPEIRPKPGEEGEFEVVEK